MMMMMMIDDVASETILDNGPFNQWSENDVVMSFKSGLHYPSVELVRPQSRMASGPIRRWEFDFYPISSSKLNALTKH